MKRARTPRLVTALAILGLTGCSQAPPAASPDPESTTQSTQPSAAPPRLHVARADVRLPVAFGREAVISDGHQAVVAGGLSSADSSLASAYRIDLRTSRVTPMPAIPVPVHDTAGGLAGGRLIVIGGGNTVEQSVVQAWDGDRWRVTGHLPQARSDLSAASVGGRVVVYGGYAGTRPAEPDVLGTADGTAWDVIGTLPVPVRYAASAVADHAIWLFGGQVGNAMQTAIQRLNPSTGRTEVVSRMPIPTGHAVALAFGGRILVAGGRTGSDTITDRMWWFNPRTSSVRPAGRLPGPLADSAVAEWGDRYFLIGGETPSMTNQILKVTYR